MVKDFKFLLNYEIINKVILIIYENDLFRFI